MGARVWQSVGVSEVVSSKKEGKHSGHRLRTCGSEGWQRVDVQHNR